MHALKGLFFALLLIGLIASLAGGTMLVLRAMERMSYTSVDVIDNVVVSVESLSGIVGS